MYKSATVKLTGWYLLILMSISLLFSVIIYRVAESEVATRLDGLQAGIQRESDISSLPRYDYRALRARQADQAADNLFVSLLYTNILILAAGGIGSYVLARRTLRPIEHAHEAQSRFTSDASHELRTPLAIMKTELEVALRDPNLTKEEMKELLGSNLEEVNKLAQLSHTLLQLSKLDHSSFTKQRFALDEVARDVIKRCDKTGARVSFSPPPHHLLIDANQISIEELITILVENAIKYSPDDSAVHVTTTTRNKKACFEIKNSGKGIITSDLPYIFDRFYRADSSRTGGDKNGYGLGLSLAKKIVELHNGELSASSAKDQETTFTFLLPLYNKNQLLTPEPN